MNFTNFDRLPAEWSMTCLGLLSGEFARNGDCASVQRLDRDPPFPVIVGKGNLLGTHEDF